MVRRKSVFLAVAATLAFFLCLSGCQGSKDKSLEKIKKAKVIRISMSPGYPPFSYYNAKKEVVGFDVSVSREIAKRLGVELKVLAVPWEEIINSLNAGESDAILGSMAITEERSKLVDFSVPYYYARSLVMVPKDSKIKTLKDLRTKTVGVMTFSTFENDAKTLELPHVRQYKTNDDALGALSKGEVDAVITDDVVGMYAKNRMGLVIEPLGDTLNSDRIAIAVRKGETALLTRINEIIGEMKKDDTLQHLVEKMAANKLDKP
jgi:polar amino acid transport system substrate-binding protein